jgi:hypothetical protein
VSRADQLRCSDSRAKARLAVSRRWAYQDAGLFHGPGHKRVAVFPVPGSWVASPMKSWSSSTA